MGQHARQRGLNPRHSRVCGGEAQSLVRKRVRGMIGGDAIDCAILQPIPQRVAVVRVANRWIHLQARADSFDVSLIESEVLRTYFGGNQITFVRC